MQVSELKEYLLNNDLIEDVLSALGCGHIKNHGEYISASNPDGDNKNAVIVYVNENITCVDYTRTLVSSQRTTDIFDLIMYFKNQSFPEALRWVCQAIGIGYYDECEELPESLQLLKLLKQMSDNTEGHDECPLKPIPEEILSYYLPYGNIMLEDDGISLSTQHKFEVMYDPCTNSICFPIRDEIGSLIAVKARRFKYTTGYQGIRRFRDELEDGENKYFYIFPGAKSQILFGLFQNFKSIQQQGIVFVGESEKFVLQIHDMGFYGVSTCGAKVSKRQVEMLTRLGVKICFCFDKDISDKELSNIADMFLEGIDIYAMIDKDNILSEKQSPSDDVNKWHYMIQNNIYKIK